jgi:hypothetical protein
MSEEPVELVFEYSVGDIVTAKGQSQEYEVLEVFQDGKVKLHPLVGSLGDFTMKGSHLSVKKTPKIVTFEKKKK